MRIRERFNPRAPCGARRHGCRYGQPDRTISTHAPLAGRDCRCRMGRRWSDDFNPRAPCGARPIPKSVKQVSALISTHAPLAGRDT